MGKILIATISSRIYQVCNFKTGASLVDIETMPVRMATGGQDTLGPSATFVYNNREKNVNKELWRVMLR